MNKRELLETGKKVLSLEASAVRTLAEMLDENFLKAVDFIVKCRGKVVVSGMGKAGLIGQKIASTFSSLGRSSFFMHPADASHGDLGMVKPEDVVILLSNSGESAEVTTILPALRVIGASLIAVTGNPDSVLARKSDIVLLIGKVEEACLMGLAPTTSTTAMLAMGDALAVSAMKRDGTFDEARYAFFHPSGALGKKLLTVDQVMRKKTESVIATEDRTVRDILFAITKMRAGLAALVDHKEILIGVFTDGDLRRALEGKEDILHRPVREVMTREPRAIDHKAYALQALKMMRDHRIGDLPVVDGSRRPVGVISMKDLVTIGLF